MIKVTELGGIARVFNLKEVKGKESTLRLLARQSKDIHAEQVSDELGLAEKAGIISLDNLDNE